MRLLLDTHAFLWSYSDRKKLPSQVKDAIADRDNEVLVSAVTFWEIAIKMRLGKLQPVGEHPPDLIAVAERLGFVPMPISPAEAASYANLTEATHSDPFDRMLAWQSIMNGAILVSRDPAFKRFRPDGLRTLWK